jgi:hypothetical protein
MFGWFAHALAAVCPHYRADAGHSRWLQVDPEAWLPRLSLLGSVLYLPMQADDEAGAQAAHGWVAERTEWLPLLQVRRMLAHGVIGADGPREWIECFDGEGRLCARLHLLPDTDYLAWDLLLAAGRPDAPPRRVLRPFRPAAARLAQFRQRRLGGLRMLGGAEVCRLSPLGRGIAREVAGADALELAGDGGG